MSRTPFTDALSERAMHAYHSVAAGREVADDRGPLHSAGALLSFHGLAQNGGLVGGAVENLFHTRVDPLLEDAVRAFRRFGVPAAAELVERADGAYRRFRPTGYEDLDPTAEALWVELDHAYGALVTDEAVEAALLAHAGELSPVTS